MASVRKKSGSKFYFACFRGADQARMQVSTKEVCKKRAMKVAFALEEAAMQRASQSALLKNFNRISEDLYAKPMRVDTVRAFVDAVIAQRSGEISHASQKRYRQVADAFLTHLGPKADQPFRDVGYDSLVAFRNSVAERTTAANANTYMKCLRTFFTHGLAEQVITEDPTRRIKLLVEEKKPASEKRRPFTEDELVRLFQAAGETSAEWKWMIVIASLTGQRLGDIATMQWSNVTCSNEDHVIWQFVTGKTRREMVLPLPREHFEAMAAEVGRRKTGKDTFVFPTAAARVSLSGRTNALSNQFAKIMAKAGLQPKRDHKRHKDGRNRSRTTSQLGFHALRHTVTSTLSAAGEARAVVMDLVGHDSAEMSQVYTHTELKQKAEAQKKLLARIKPLARVIT